MLTREEYVDICKTCTLRTSNMKQGIICSLTQEHAAFEESVCPDYKHDEVASTKVVRELNDKRSGNNVALVAGTVLFIGGIVWLIAGLYVGLLFFYSIISIIAGAAILVISIGRIKKFKSKVKPSDDEILD